MSLDPPGKQAAFAQAERVPFPMIGDSGQEIGRAFGVLRLGGWLLAKRVTFVIDKQGIIRAVIRSELNIDHHIAEATNVLRQLARS